MPRYRITVTSPDRITTEFSCGDDQAILAAAQEAGLDLPYGCRNGVCGTCVHRIASGRVDQGSQMALDDDALAAGLTVLCIGRPLCDVDLLDPSLDA
jgi:ferredoxin